MLAPSRSVRDHSSDSSPETAVGWMLRLWSPFRRSLAVILGLTVLNAFVLITYPLLLRNIIDGVETAADPRVLARDAWLLVGIAIVNFALYFTLQYLRARQNIRFEFSGRMLGFTEVMRWNRSQKQGYRTGDLVTRLTDDVTEKLSWYLCSGAGRAIEAGLLVITGVGMMLWLNPWLTLWTAGPLPILIGLLIFTGSRLHSRYQTVQATISDMGDALEGCFSGVRVVQAFGAEPMQQRMLDGTIERQRQAEVEAVRWQTLIDSLYGNIWQLGIVGVLLAGGTLAIRGGVTIGELVAFDAYVLMLVWPMYDIGQFFVRGKLCRVAVDRLRDLEAETRTVTPDAAPAEVLRPDDVPTPICERPDRSGGAIGLRFEAVTATYPSADRPAFDRLSLDIPAGRMTAITGPVGAGKSTLLSTMIGLMPISGGQMLVDGQPLEELDLNAYRSRCGYVPQEPELLAGTIAENIRFGRDWITEADMTWAVRAAGLENEVAGWEDGLATVVGSRGTRLSGGQKQRVCLARALAGRPGLVLLDDCTASLDTQTEERVWNAILSDLPDCTIVVVTHRPSTLARADKVITLHNGQVITADALPDPETRRSHSGNKRAS